MSQRRTKTTNAAKERRIEQSALLKAIQWGLYLTLATPLLTWKRVLVPELTPKVLAFQVLTEILCGLSLIAFVRPKRREETAEASQVVTPSVLALAGFIGVSCISALFGADLIRSLWGFVERQDGLVFWIHLLLWTLILVWTLRRHREPRKLLFSYMVFSVCVSVVVSLTILHESYQARSPGDRFFLLRMLDSSARSGGVFGNPVYAGPYLLFHFFWALFAVGKIADSARRGKRASRLMWAAGLLIAELLIVLAMLVGQTRGVIFGVAAGLGAMAIWAAFTATQRAARLAATVGLLLLVLGIGTVWHYRDTELVSQVPLLSRLTRLSAAENASTSNRLLAWRSTLKGVPDRPLLGWGPRNVYYALNKYYDPRHVQFTADFYDRSNTWYDKSHNAYLDLLAEGGLLGLAGFLVLAAVVFRSLLKMRDRWLALCLTGALAGYWFSNIVSFDTFGALLGLCLSLAAISLEEDPVEWRRWQRARTKKVKAAEVRSPYRLTRKLAVMVSGLLLLLALYSNVRIAQANHGYFMARNYFMKDPGAGITWYEDTFRYFSPYDADEKLKCAYQIINAAITNRPSSRSFDAGSMVLKLTSEALSRHPDDAQFYLLLNDMYNGLAMYGDRRLADEAERFGRKSLELSPGRQETMFTLGRTYIIKGEAAKAVEINRRMVQEYPEFALGHWFLGLSYLSNSQRDEARDEIRTALKKGYRFQSPKEIDTIKPLFDEKEFAQFPK